MVETHDFPHEITWEVRNQEGKVLLNKGQYELARFKYFENVCLIDDIYTFTLRDAGGDTSA